MIIFNFNVVFEKREKKRYYIKLRIVIIIFYFQIMQFISFVYFPRVFWVDASSKTFIQPIFATHSFIWYYFFYVIKTNFLRKRPEFFHPKFWRVQRHNCCTSLRIHIVPSASNETDIKTLVTFFPVGYLVLIAYLHLYEFNYRLSFHFFWKGYSLSFSLVALIYIEHFLIQSFISYCFDVSVLKHTKH